MVVAHKNLLGAIRNFPKETITDFNVEPKLSGEYDIISFGENVVKRSLNVFKDQEYNNAHMLWGLTSEITDEFLTAFIGESGKSDIVNMCEEIGDCLWFTVGLLIQNDFWQEKYFERIKQTDALVLNLGFDWTDEETANKLKENNEFQQLFEAVYFQTLKAVGTINTLYKNILIKNTAKYDGKVLDDNEILEHILRLIVCLNTISIFTGKSIYEIREMNDRKLFKRYEGGTFTAEKSLNRDTDAEREILES